MIRQPSSTRRMVAGAMGKSNERSLTSAARMKNHVARRWSFLLGGKVTAEKDE